jgi:hypothetical protein
VRKAQKKNVSVAGQKVNFQRSGVNNRPMNRSKSGRSARVLHISKGETRPRKKQRKRSKGQCGQASANNYSFFNEMVEKQCNIPE